MTSPESEEDDWKKCCGCTSLRSGTIIIGTFDIVLSSIAIIVSVAAIVNTQVPFDSLKIYETFIQGESLVNTQVSFYFLKRYETFIQGESWIGI